MIHAAVFADWFVPFEREPAVAGLRRIRVTRTGYSDPAPAEPGGRTSLRPVRRWLLHWAGRRDGDPQRVVGARAQLDPEVGGLDGQRGQCVQLVVTVVDEFEPLQQHSQDERGLLESELTTDAGAFRSRRGDKHWAART